MQTPTPHPPKHGGEDNLTIIGEPAAPISQKEFMFGRLFSRNSGFPMLLHLSSCARIGERMTAMPDAARGDSDIPAGYTYFGQFVDHDISMDATKKHLESDAPGTDAIEPTSDDVLMQARSPSLDLDSLYGAVSGVRPDLVDGALFHIGQTTPLLPQQGKGHVDKALPHDLPRRGPKREALIGDPRNDENLAVAQTHLMWLKFHNEVAKTLTRQNPGTDPSTILVIARDIVTRHYQHIVLHDFLPRMIDPDVYEDIIVNGNRKILDHVCGEMMFMPLEFSVAAYRHGHSMVREVYDWNVNFPAEGPRTGSLANLFRFSQVSGDLLNEDTLLTNWVPDFRRLYDLSGFDFPALAGGEKGLLNKAKSLDPYLAPSLGNLPEINKLPANMRPPFSNLAALNLRRGSMRALPSGQDVSRALPSVKMLSKAQMRGAIDAEFDADMDRLGFYDRTPLWLYILLEAKAVGKGQRMGQMGSTLLADVFRTLVMTSRTSILCGRVWTPADAQDVLAAPEPLSTIPHILAWLDARAPIVDPLQDDRIV